MKKIKYLLIAAIYLHTLSMQCLEKVTYTFSNDPIDVVIPCHKKDAPFLDQTIKSIQKHIRSVRRIIVISDEPFTDQAEWASEQLFPFTKESIALEIAQSKEPSHNNLGSKEVFSIGWIYQQFLKLFAAYYIPDISSNILIVDADVVFLKQITFLQKNGAGLYAFKNHFKYNFFTHISVLLPDLTRYYQGVSGVMHHMLFQKPVLDDLFNLIRTHHSLEPWVAIARTIPHEPHLLMSEYELYFNFVLARTDQAKVRWLRFGEVENTQSRADIFARLNDHYHYVTFHMRPHQKN